MGGGRNNNDDLCVISLLYSRTRSTKIDDAIRDTQKSAIKEEKGLVCKDGNTLLTSRRSIPWGVS